MSNAVQMLQDDHQRVKGLFEEFKHAPQGDKRRIVKTVLTELEIHAKIEEEVFYPTVRLRIKDHELMDEADEEHRVVEHLLLELKGMKPGDSYYDAKFTVLAENVTHHIQEEESEMFPKAASSGLDLTELGERMAQRKEQLMERAQSDPSDGNGASQVRVQTRKRGRGLQRAEKKR
ncbi:MAG: hemerythrin domain-containing protein [Candidatus Omnitrophota bacterium]|nr:hemerythrin domain-containing protein [Candidatus Omnitrophota bacterium]